MKLLSLLCLFSSSLAFADLRVGDRAVYALVPTSGAVDSQTPEIRWTVLAFDKRSKTYTTQTQFEPYAPTTLERAGDSIEATESREKIFDECRSRGGEYVTVHVVSGTYKTCHIVFDNTESWIAREIRCADIKSTLYDSQGDLATIELKDYFCAGVTQD